MSESQLLSSCALLLPGRNCKPYVSNNQETRYCDEFLSVPDGRVEPPSAPAPPSPPKIPLPGLPGSEAGSWPIIFLFLREPSIG